MTKDDPDKQLDQLAVEIEQKIAENKEFLNELPDFAPRSQRSQKLQQKVGKQP